MVAVFFLCLSLFHADDFRLGLFLVAAVDDGDDSLGEVDESEARSCVAAEGGGGAGITIVADALHKRNLGKQGDFHLLSEVLAAFLAEDIVFVLRQFGGGKP